MLRRPGTPSAPTPPSPDSHGIRGMRERAELYGGILTAGPRNPTDAMLRAGVAKAWFDSRPGPYAPEA